MTAQHSYCREGLFRRLPYAMGGLKEPLLEQQRSRQESAGPSAPPLPQYGGRDADAMTYPVVQHDAAYPPIQLPGN